MQSSNLDDIARLRFGQKLSKLPKGVKTLPNCYIEPKRPAFDCEFIDADGNAYLVEGKEIVRLERRPEIASRSPLPYRLKFGMPIPDVVRALAAQDRKIFWMIKPVDNDEFVVDTGECLKDRHGLVYGFIAEFDKTGRLNKIRASFITESQ